MKLCSEISQENLLTDAFDLVGSAKEEIFATMYLDEEIEQPLPEEYHLLLLDKKRAGVSVVRYGYGTKRAYQKIAKLHSEIQLVYRGSIHGYQRMLLIDRQKGLFSVNKKYFYTEFLPLVQALVSFAHEAV